MEAPTLAGLSKAELLDLIEQLPTKPDQAAINRVHYQYLERRASAAVDREFDRAKRLNANGASMSEMLAAHSRISAASERYKSATRFWREHINPERPGSAGQEH
jgi:hypothetical protein